MINLVMVLHCHQPVGNFDHVFDMAMDKCYQPLLEILHKHPAIRTGIHISGPLFEWIEKNRAEYLTMLSEMVKRDQIELLSGGFFEPLLATIPARDARGQVLMMNKYLKEHFGKTPEGFWLTERVWDPSLPLVLKDTGLLYTIVDDTHMYYSGLKADEIYGSFLTEKEGHTLAIMATPMIMRYLIPFKPVEDVIGHLRHEENLGRNIVIYGDDGEKFGLWPGTYEWVIKKGWLDNFFKAVEDNGEWLKTILPREYNSNNTPTGRIYLPQASYEEMTEWSLPASQSHALENIIKRLKEDNLWEEWRPFVRGGIWDNFLVKYYESNRMHKKMLFLSERASDNREAQEHIWRSQCNCAYWHGVFGGLYLGHLRRAIQENLIEAQKILFMKKRKSPRYITYDIDKDGNDEIILFNREVSISISTTMGGGIFDISHLPTCYNLTDTLTRRFEAYHYDINNNRNNNEQSSGDGIASIHDIKETGINNIDELLVVDPYPRISLLDHFVPNDLSLESYSRADYSVKTDPALERYNLNQISSVSKMVTVELSRSGSEERSLPDIKKEISLSDRNEIYVNYTFTNNCTEFISKIYGCEFNLNLYSDQDPEKYYYLPESEKRIEISKMGEERKINTFELINNPDKLKITFSFSTPAEVWYFPLMTVSKTEEGFEYTYQGSNLLFRLPMELPPEGIGEFRLKIILNSLL